MKAKSKKAGAIGIAIVVICLVFNAVTKSLNLFKKRVLRWQEGMVK